MSGYNPARMNLVDLTINHSVWKTLFLLEELNSASSFVSLVSSSLSLSIMLPHSSAILHVLTPIMLRIFP